MSLSFKFIPLTFLNDKNEIKKQIRNTIILKYFFEINSEIVHLEDLITGTQYGYNASALAQGRNKFLRISDITDGKVNWNTVPYCDCTDEETYLLFPNDILIARTGGTTGKSFLISEPPAFSIYAGYLIRIRANEETNPNYLTLFLNSYVYWSQIVSLNEDNFRPSVNANKLKKLILPKCDETVQNDAVRIANGELINGYDDLYQLIDETLLKYDKLIEIQIEKNNQLELQKTLKQSILSEAIHGKLTTQWREENPNIEVASILFKRIKKEKIQLIKEKKIKKEKELLPITEKEIPFQLPKNWVWSKLGDICLKVHYGINASAIPEKKSVRLLRITDIQDNRVNWETVPGCDYTKSDLENYSLNVNDILIARTGGTIGKTYLVKNIALKSLFASYLIRAIPSSEISAEYLKFFMESPIYWSQLLNAAWGAGQPNVNGTSLSNLIIPIPPIYEQKVIVGKIESLFKNCNALKNEIIKSEQHAQILMQVILKEAFEVKELI